MKFSKCKKEIMTQRWYNLYFKLRKLHEKTAVDERNGLLNYFVQFM